MASQRSTKSRERPSPPTRRTAERMRAVRRRDTSPELALRSLLHRRGLRFRVDVAPLIGSRRRADVVFTRARLAVFLDGCFWHSCPWHGTIPRSNTRWWVDKLEANVRRDRSTDRELEACGWAVVRIWEHETPATAADRVVHAYLERLREL